MKKFAKFCEQRECTIRFQNTRTGTMVDISMNTPSVKVVAEDFNTAVKKAFRIAEELEREKD